MRYIAGEHSGRGSLRREAWFALSLVAMLLSACGTTRIVPVQMGRVSQLELYEQRFVFDAPEGLAEAERLRHLTGEMERVFVSFLGERNWRSIRELHGGAAFRDDVLTGRIYVKGWMNLVLSPDPMSPNHFLLEGLGRYVTLRELAAGGAEILLSGDFHVDPRKYLFTTLDQGVLEIPVRLFTTRLAGATTFLHDAEVVYRIHLDTRLSKHSIYSLDYSRTHEARVDGEVFGQIRFLTTQPTDKLLDLRGLRFLRDDYAPKLREAGPVDEPES